MGCSVSTRSLSFLANIDNFWQPLLSLLGHMRDEAFIRSGLEVRFVTVDRAEDIVPAIQASARALRGPRRKRPA